MLQNLQGWVKNVRIEYSRRVSQLLQQGIKARIDGPRVDGGKVLQELNETQLKHCNVFIDSWEATASLELRADFKDKDLVIVNLSKLLAMRTHRQTEAFGSAVISRSAVCLVLCYNFVEHRVSNTKLLSLWSTY